MAGRYGNIEGIIILIFVLGVVAGLFLYIGQNVPQEMSEPFITIGNTALAGVIIVIIVIVVIVLLVIYGYTQKR